MTTGTAVDLKRARILDHFRDLCERAPARDAVTDATTGRRASRAEIAGLGAGIGNELVRRGARKHDRVALLMRNSVEFLAAVVAALSQDLTLVPLDRDAKEVEIDTIINRLGIRFLIDRDDNGVHVHQRTIGGTNPSHDQSGNPIALIKLTSGSSGAPKGVLTGERQLIADCDNICRSMGIREEDLSFAAIPLSHSYGFSNLVTPLLLHGTPMVVANDYLPHLILETCNRYGCTVIPGVPTMFSHLADLPPADGMFKTVRMAISAGAPLSADISRAFHNRHNLAIHSFYGCSECGGIAFDRAGRSVERGTVGEPLEGVEILFEEQTGRVVVRSDAVGAGYLNGSEGEDRKFVDGSFMTDDLGIRNGRGEIVLTGRVNDLINMAGRKVNPREVEAVILEIDGVREARVYGRPGGARGEIVAAAVVASGDISTDQIRRYCARHLSSHKVPRIVKLIDAIPVDERGKVRRADLIAL